MSSIGPNALIAPSREGSVLDRLHRPSLIQTASLTPLQSQVDGLVGGFTEQATDWRSLSAMLMGGMAYRTGRVAVMGRGIGAVNNAVTRSISVLAGLTAEVSAFEMTHRSLLSFTQSSALNPHSSPNLWRWDGQGGIRQGLLQSFITFGTIKSAGRLASGENLVVQHLMQDSAMVLGHNASAIFGIAPRPTGTLTEQFLHAEATNLQIGAGMALAQRMAPGMHALERGLALSIQLTPSPLSLSLEGEGGRRSGEGGLTRRFEPELALAAGDPSVLGEFSERPFDPILGPQILMMARPKRGSGGRRSGVEKRSASVERPRVTREEVGREIESITTKLEGLQKRYELTLLRLLELSKKRRQDQHLETLVRRLEPKEAWISREVLMGRNAPEPKGPLETWEISRLVDLVHSQKYAFRECRRFLRKLKLPSDLPEVRFESGLVLERSIDRLNRLFRNLKLESVLVKRVMAMIPHSEENRRDQNELLVRGIEGLMVLIDEAPRDERKAIVKMMERITYAEPADFETLREFLFITMNYQYGALSRQNVMSAVHSSNTFHETYPLARGSFLKLFRMTLAPTSEAYLVETPLAFARERLEAGDRVTLEPQTSTGFATLLVQSSTGEKSRYIVGGIVDTLHDQRGFLRVASRLIKAFPEQNPQENVPNRIFIEIPSLDPHVSPERLRSWAIDFFVNQGERTIEALTRQSADEDVREMGFEYHRLPKREKDALVRRLMEERREYWSRMIPNLDRVELSYSAPRPSLKGRKVQGPIEADRQRENIDRNSASLERSIASLRERVVANPQEADVVRLFTILAESRRWKEALELLRSEMRKPENGKKLKHLYREALALSLTGIFGDSNEYNIFDPPVLNFFSNFFGKDFTSESISNLFDIGHPGYLIPSVIVSKGGKNSLRFYIPIVTRFNEEAGEFHLYLNFGEKSSQWTAEISNAEMVRNDKVNHQGRGIGLFMMERIIRFLQEIGVSRLEFEGDRDGRYAWLRMGAEFVNHEQRDGVANKLRSFLDEHAYQVSSPLRSRLKTSEGIAEILSSLDEDHLSEFLSDRWIGMPRYFLMLDPGSPQLKRFQAYYLKRAAVILKNSSGEVN